MQRLGMLFEVALDLVVRARLQPVALMREVARQHGAECLGDLIALLDLLAGRIAAEPDGGEQILGGVARLAEIDRAHLPERHAAMLGADLVLDHEGA